MATVLAAATVWNQWVWPVLVFLIGLGVVVFIHELGHFLAAKWVGIKVERFAIGFGPRLVGVRAGETDYCLCALPLGGYVKMLGQEDFAPLKENEKPDPRSYEAKSVGARFFVISAGVLMNVMLSAVLFIVVGLVGMDFAAPVVGSVIPGYPAAEARLSWTPETPAVASAPATAPASAPATSPATSPASAPAGGPANGAATAPPGGEAGIQPGDRIVSIDGEPVARFADVQMKALFSSGRSEAFRLVVRREDSSGRTWIGTGAVGVKRSPTGMMRVFGMESAASTVFASEDVVVDTPFKAGDRLVAVAGHPVRHSWDLSAIEEDLTGQPVDVTVVRKGQDMSFTVQPAIMLKGGVIWLDDGRRAEIVSAEPGGDGATTYQVEFPGGGEKVIGDDRIAGGSTKEKLDVLGMIPRLSVLAVVDGSPAQEAGIEPGDIIAGYGDHGAPTHDELLAISRKVEGRSTEIVVLRGEKRVTLHVRPKYRKPAGEDEGYSQIGIVDIADVTHSVVAGVRPGSLAEKAGVLPEDVVEGVNGRPADSWVDVIRALREHPEGTFRLSLRRGAQSVDVTVTGIGPAAFSPDEYEIKVFPLQPFKPLMVLIRKRNPVAAVAWGAGETWKFMVRTYATLKALVVRSVSTSALVGPIGIGAMGIRVVREEPLIDFVYLIAFISATLAVINFLPFPVVDGGHAAFLIAEKIRGKPLPVKVMNITQGIGLALLALVFILLTWQDLARLISGLW